MPQAKSAFQRRQTSAHIEKGCTIRDWFDLPKILDDYNRVRHRPWTDAGLMPLHRLEFGTTMMTGDVTDVLGLALKASGCNQATVLNKPQLLNGKSSSHISNDLADWLDDRQVQHAPGALYQPQPQGKI
ncbi:MAG: hypothetical protein AAGH74_04615 [Pseudomonadota bacterium]